METLVESVNTVRQGTQLRVLLVEDNPLDSELIVRELKRDGFDVSHNVVQTEEEFRQKIAADPYDVILADCKLPQWRGMETIEILRSERLDIPVILVTGSLGDVAAVECIKQGGHRLCPEGEIAPPYCLGTTGTGRNPPPPRAHPGRGRSA
jgi:CheY-like chemotaxis protein